MTEPVSDALLKLLGDWDGLEVGWVETEPAGDDVFGAPAPRLVLARAGALKRFSPCVAVVESIRDASEFGVRDLPLDDWDTWLVFSRARLQLPQFAPRSKPSSGWTDISV